MALQKIKRRGTSAESTATLIPAKREKERELKKLSAARSDTVKEKKIERMKMGKNENEKENERE